jgi:hypothetical protein
MNPRLAAMPATIATVNRAVADQPTRDPTLSTRQPRGNCVVPGRDRPLMSRRRRPETTTATRDQPLGGVEQIPAFRLPLPSCPMRGVILRNTGPPGDQIDQPARLVVKPTLGIFGRQPIPFAAFGGRMRADISVWLRAAWVRSDRSRGTAAPVSGGPGLRVRCSRRLTPSDQQREA